MSLAIGIRLCRVPWQIDTTVSDSGGGTTLTVRDTTTFDIAAIRELIGLSRVMLASGHASLAREYCAEALSLDVPGTAYQAALALNIARLHENWDVAPIYFSRSASLCQALLAATPGLYEVLNASLEGAC